MDDLGPLRFSLQSQIAESSRQNAIAASKMVGLRVPCIVKSVAANTLVVTLGISGMSSIDRTVVFARSLYAREPIQKGDPGFVTSLSAEMAYVFGATQNPPAMRTTGNLANLVFFPIASPKWDAPDDLNSYYISGPNGFLIQSADGSVSVKGVKGGALTMASGSNKIEVSSSGVAITGKLTINGAAYLDHEHTNGNEGANTGAVVA